MQNSPPNCKRENSADIVILLDVTSSMLPCIEAVRTGINDFIDFLSTSEGVQENPIKDWRLKICGYRDFEYDEYEPSSGTKGPGWFVEQSFTRDVKKAKDFLGSQAMSAFGGGDDDESLLDALYKIVSMKESDPSEEHPEQWRSLKNANRVLIYFTDADFKKTVTAPEGRGAGIDDIKTSFSAKRILLCGFAPPTDGHYMLGEIELAVIEPQENLTLAVQNKKGFEEILKKLAETISKTAESNYPQGF